MEVEKNENGHHRGLHIVVINPESGMVESAKAFDTYKSSEGLDKFLDTATIPDRHIVITACKDDCVTHLSDKAKRWLYNLGSTQAF